MSQRRYPPRPRRLRLAVLLGAAMASVAAGLSHGIVRPAALDPPPPPKVGFTFSGWAARYAGQDPATGLATLLDRLAPDVVRLPVYWNDVAVDPQHLDFSGVDSLLERIVAYDAEGGHTAVVLVVGIRNVGFPELWIPHWALPLARGGLPSLVRLPEYHTYLEAAVRRYRESPLLLGWQVENEPFDDVESGYSGSSSLAPDAIAAEVRLVHHLDGRHPVMLTTYNSAAVDLDEVGMSIFADVWRLTDLPQFVGHPLDALRAGDVLGLDAYVVTTNTPIDEASVAERLEWKFDSLVWWADYAHEVGKPFWIAEMQAMPWQGIGGFSTADLLESASLYRNVGADALLLYGVEYWLAHPDWLLSGTRAVRILRRQEAAVPLP